MLLRCLVLPWCLLLTLWGSGVNSENSTRGRVDTFRCSQLNKTDLDLDKLQGRWLFQEVLVLTDRFNPSSRELLERFLTASHVQQRICLATNFSAINTTSAHVTIDYDVTGVSEPFRGEGNLHVLSDGSLDEEFMTKVPVEFTTHDKNREDDIPLTLLLAMEPTEYYTIVKCALPLDAPANLTVTQVKELLEPKDVWLRTRRVLSEEETHRLWTTVGTLLHLQDMKGRIERGVGRFGVHCLPHRPRDPWVLTGIGEPVNELNP